MMNDPNTDTSAGSSETQPLKEQVAHIQQLIKQQRYTEARTLLEQIDHPKAAEWIERINRIDPALDPFRNLPESVSSSASLMPPEESFGALPPVVRKEHPLDRVRTDDFMAAPGSAAPSARWDLPDEQTGSGSPQPVPPIGSEFGSPFGDAAPRKSKGVPIGPLVLVLVILLAALVIGLLRMAPRSYTSQLVYTTLPNQWYIAGEDADATCQQTVSAGSRCLLVIQHIDTGFIPSAVIGTHYANTDAADLLISLSRSDTRLDLPVQQIRAIIATQMDAGVFLQAFSPNLANVQASERFDRTVMNELAQGIEFTATLTNGSAPAQMLGRIMLFPHDQYLYELDVFAAPSSGWETYREDVDAILNSLDFASGAAGI